MEDGQREKWAVQLPRNVILELVAVGDSGISPDQSMDSLQIGVSTAMDFSCWSSADGISFGVSQNHTLSAWCKLHNAQQSVFWVRCAVYVHSIPELTLTPSSWRYNASHQSPSVFLISTHCVFKKLTKSVLVLASWSKHQQRACFCQKAHFVWQQMDINDSAAAITPKKERYVRMTLFAEINSEVT